MTDLPLHGLYVADFSRILAGPLCTMMLADAGADVIKIEEPRGDETRRWGPPFAQDGTSAYFTSVNRNKRSIVLDLRKDRGREIAAAMIRRADVVVENFKPDDRLQFGLSVATVRALNPRAIHCSIRGFERETAESESPGYDLLAQAVAGLMAITGPVDGAPHKVGVAMSDVLTAHYAYGAICTALLARERSGQGKHVEISIVGATAASLVNVAQNHLVTGDEATRWGNQHPSIVPYQAFAAADRPFVLAVASDRHFEVLCREVLHHPELSSDRRYSTNALRVTNRDSLIEKLSALFVEEAAAEWLERAASSGIPAALVQSVAETFQTVARPLLSTAPDSSLQLVAHPVRFDGERFPIRRGSPELGADEQEVLRELGMEG